MIVLMINERQAVQIALGHELVHALRTMNGNRKRGARYIFIQVLFLSWESMSKKSN